jgi:hypothetical protein
LTTHSILNSAALYTWLLFCALSGFQETSIRAVTETFARKGNRLLRSLRGITIRRLCRLEGEEIVSSWLTLNKGQWMRKTDKAWQNFVQIDHCYGAGQKTESAPSISTYALHAPGWRRLLRELRATFPLVNGLTNLVKGDSFRVHTSRCTATTSTGFSSICESKGVIVGASGSTIMGCTKAKFYSLKRKLSLCHKITPV